MYTFRVERSIVSGSSYEWKQKVAVEGIAELVLQEICVQNEEMLQLTALLMAFSVYLV
jgi:hypothetical protein